MAAPVRKILDQSVYSVIKLRRNNTSCRFGMTIASYETWCHFMPRNVNLECPLQIMTRDATSFRVMSIWNVLCKLRHLAPLVATWDSAPTTHLKFTALSWLSGRQKTLNGAFIAGVDEILRKIVLDRSQYGEVVQTTCPATPTAKRCVSWSFSVLDLQFRRVWLRCVRGGVPDVYFCSPSLNPRGSTLTAEHLRRVMLGSAAK
jgi:hypothetical protein